MKNECITMPVYLSNLTSDLPLTHYNPVFLVFFSFCNPAKLVPTSETFQLLFLFLGGPSPRWQSAFHLFGLSPVSPLKNAFPHLPIHKCPHSQPSSHLLVTFPIELAVPIWSHPVYSYHMPSYNWPENSLRAETLSALFVALPTACRKVLGTQ